MGEILQILIRYKGDGILLVLYIAALVYLWLREKDRTLRALLVWMPLFVLIAFLLPPVYRLYARVETDTYYRVLWLLPMSLTICYAGLRLSVRLLGRVWPAGALCLALFVVLGGNYVYDNVNILKAENRLHLPHQVIDVCDFLLDDTGGVPLKAAMPAELVQYVRQYTASIDLAYGREMVVPQWHYYNAVYEAMEESETIDAPKLVSASREAQCSYIVLNASREIRGDLAGEGLVLAGEVDGFRIWKDPSVPVIDYSIWAEAAETSYSE